MPWHLTPTENVDAILREGLQPAIGARSAAVGEAHPLVHCFSSFGDLCDGEWVWDAFNDDTKLALIHVAVPGSDGAWTELDEPVPADRLRLLSRDAGEISGREVILALSALDAVTDPLADLESFRRTITSMKASSFGRLVGDAAWEGDDSPFLVYAGAYWLERKPDGQVLLTIGRESWLAADDEGLADLEARLFDYARGEHRAGREPVPEAGPSF